jgi:hypothetical protein
MMMARERAETCRIDVRAKRDVTSKFYQLCKCQQVSQRQQQHRDGVNPKKDLPGAIYPKVPLKTQSNW